MSIATRFVSSTARPRLDLKGCVFYAPLWRPDLGGSTFTTIGDGGIPTHLCTVTGATWGYQGRTFNGSSAKITATLPAALSPPYTLLVWAKQTVIPTNYGIFDADTGVKALLFQGAGDGLIHFNNGSQIDGNLVTAGFHLYSVIVNGANSSIQTDLATATVGTLGAVSITDIVIGRRNDATPWWFDGRGGEVSLFNRAFTTLEKAQYYLSTKWRFT